MLLQELKLHKTQKIKNSPLQTITCQQQHKN